RRHHAAQHARPDWPVSRLHEARAASVSAGANGSGPRHGLRRGPARNPAVVVLRVRMHLPVLVARVLCQGGPRLAGGCPGRQQERARGGGGMRRAIGFALALVLVPALASAKVQLTVSYSYDAVWPGALRFVEVDRGWRVSQRDKEAGFVRFLMVEDKKDHVATLELIRVIDTEGRDAVRLQLSTVDLARYQEAPVLDALARTPPADLGPPAPPL